MSEPRTGGTRTAGCLVRLFWFFFGNVILLITASFIARHRDRFLSLADLIYWATVACIMAARYVDIKRLNGLTAAGQPASMSHWRRYVLLVSVLALALWGAAHAVAKFAA